MNRIVHSLALALALWSSGVTAPARAAEYEVSPALLLEAGGSLVVATDGSVESVAIDTPLSPALHDALQASLGKMRFEPIRIKGELVRAKTGFHVVLAGTREGESIRARIDAITFPAPKGETPELAPDPEQTLRPGRLDPPRFPRAEQMSGIMGTVKLAIRITPEGRTGDVQVVEGMIYDTGVSPVRARRALRNFEVAALGAARGWSYKVPADAAIRNADQMTATTLVAFIFDLKGGFDLSKPGQWLPVQRAQSQPIAWLPREKSRQMLDQAVAVGGLAGGESRFRLQTPMAGAPVL